MIDLLTIFGGVALLVFGVRYLRKALDRLFGPRLGTWIRRLADRPSRAFAAGVSVAVITPSSTTISLLSVQLIRTNQLTARSMLTLLLGANIGLTVMVLLIALRVESYAPIVILAGTVLFIYFDHPKVRGVGQFLLAFGFIFLGIDVMRRAAEAGLDTGLGMDGLINFEQLQDRALLLAAFGAIFTLLLQSSTAAIALVIGLGAASAVSFRFAAPVVVGANIGMACTTLIVAWRTTEARRLALANLLLKSIVAVVAMTAIKLIGTHLPEPRVEYMSYAIVGVHTGFNIAVAALGLPTVGPVTSLVTAMTPVSADDGPRRFSPRYITSPDVSSVALSLGLSLHEILHVSEVIREMYELVWKALKNSDERLVQTVIDRDDQVDLLDEAIKTYLTRLVKEEQDQADADEQMRQLRYVSELETIGDIIDKNICQLVLKKIRLGVSFSEEGEKELDDFYNRVAENLTIAETAFTTRDQQLAQQLLRHKEQLNQYETELRDRHFDRLNAGLAESHETSAIHLDLLIHLKRINSSLSHVAYAILRDRPSSR